MKVAFQCRQPEGSYSIGQETVGAGSTRIDPIFSNNEVEWYTERIGSPVLYGLLIKLQDVDSSYDPPPSSPVLW